MPCGAALLRQAPRSQLGLCERGPFLLQLGTVHVRAPHSRRRQSHPSTGGVRGSFSRADLMCFHLKTGVGILLHCGEEGCVARYQKIRGLEEVLWKPKVIC